MPVARTCSRGRPADARHQRGIVRRAEPDVVREERRAVDVVVPWTASVPQITGTLTFMSVDIDAR
jgi:hypothetical protein